MSRHKTEESWVTTARLKVSTKPMIDVLTSKGYYPSASQMIDTLIRKEFTSRVGNPKEDLLRAKKQLEETIKALEDMTEKMPDIDDIIKDYKKRKSGILPSDMRNYEKSSIAWIKGNSKVLSAQYPGLAAELIFHKLEELIK